MTEVVPSLSAVLERLSAESSDGDFARDLAAGLSAELLDALSGEVERLTITVLDQSLHAAPALVRAADALGQARPRARTRRAFAQVLSYANRFDEALVLLSEAIEVADGAGETLEAAQARMTTLHALARLGRLPEAIIAGEQARAAFALADESLLAARADINLGVVHRMGDEPRRALSHFDRAALALEGHPTLLAPLQSNRAEALLDLHDFQGASRAFKGAMLAFEAAGASRAAAIVEGNLADLKGRQGQIQAALHHFERARRRLGENDAPGDVARLWVEQAEALSVVGLMHEADESFQLAIPTLRARGMRAELGRALVGLARALLERGDTNGAAASLDEASQIFRAAANTTGQARVAMLSAAIAERSGHADAAIEELRFAVNLLVDRPADRAAARLQLAGVLLTGGLVDDAEREAHASMALAEELDLPPLRADVLRVIACCRAASGDPRGARDRLCDAVAQLDRVRGTLGAEALRTAFLGRRASVYADAASAFLDEQTDEGLALAFGYIEAAKSRSLQEALHGSPGDEREPAAPDSDELRAER